MIMIRFEAVSFGWRGVSRQEVLKSQMAKKACRDVHDQGEVFVREPIRQQRRDWEMEFDSP
jgi:hypothetical protein